MQTLEFRFSQATCLFPYAGIASRLGGGPPFTQSYRSAPQAVSSGSDNDCCMITSPVPSHILRLVSVEGWLAWRGMASSSHPTYNTYTCSERGLVGTTPSGHDGTSAIILSELFW
ncbi:hypothetical protein J6590_010641 [Homalodisca vitripennis]|nr:hypothetical protein J6590_010641 [Homalodisca vitripennis]